MTLNTRLEHARRALFVGRQAELELFRTALISPEPPFVVLHIVGAGGVGKTTLLREFERIAAEQGHTILRVDGRDIEPSPSCLRDALGALPATPVVLFVDTYEALAPIDRWLRESFLPTLPAQSMVVIAGRNEPSAAWRTDLAWAALTRIITLRGLHPDEGRAFLTARGIAADQQNSALTFTHGHPLALSLVADVLTQSDAPITLDTRPEPELVRVLVERFVRDVPSAAHRTALAVCAIALTTTEGLLAELLGAETGHECFEWLRRLSFIDQGVYGLYPHDLARDVLVADHRWRDHAGHEQLRNRLMGCFHHDLTPARDSHANRARLEWFFLLRFLPFMEQYFDWYAMESAYAEPATPADAEAILAIVRTHEGDESASIAAHWLRRQPQAFHVFRNSDRALVGFMTQLALHEANEADLALDPAARLAMQWVRQHDPPRAGEEVSALRFWAHRERYQQKTAAINLVAIQCTQYWMEHTRLSWSFTMMSDPEWWQPHFDGLNFMRAPEADFILGGRRYGVFAHDWRKQPFAVWPRELPSPNEADSLPSPFQGEGPEMRVDAVSLSRTDFAAAVRQALRDYTRPDALRTNPLIQSRLMRAPANETSSGDPLRSSVFDRVAALQALIRDAAESLHAHPKDERLYRALHQTYFAPAITQERAAELLDLPFSTYRYHLTNGIERVVEWLWQREQSVH